MHVHAKVGWHAASGAGDTLDPDPLAAQKLPERCIVFEDPTNAVLHLEAGLDAEFLASSKTLIQGLGGIPCGGDVIGVRYF